MHAVHGPQVIHLHKRAEQLQVIDRGKLGPHADAGVGDQVIYAPKPLDRSLHQPLAILGYGDIPDDGQHLAPQLLALSGDSLQPLGIPR